MPLRAAVVWVIIAGLAVLNGIFRTAFLVPLCGRELALPLSGIVLSLIILLSARLARAFIGANRASHRWAVGVQWLCMTLLFEAILGHYISGNDWTALLQVLNPFNGDLFLLVLLVTLLAPSLVGRK